MRIGVLGTGLVGRTITTKLVQVGHEVRMGSRTASNEAAMAWSAGGAAASEGAFADAAEFAEPERAHQPDQLGLTGGSAPAWHVVGRARRGAPHA